LLTQCNDKHDREKIQPQLESLLEGHSNHATSASLVAIQQRKTVF
jgi:hypothetical protein